MTEIVVVLLFGAVIFGGVLWSMVKFMQEEDLLEKEDYDDIYED